MSARSSMEKVFGGDAPSKFDFVFLHGLTGHRIDTWARNDGTTSIFWPEWLSEDFGAAVYVLGYSASLVEDWSKPELDLHERAEVILEELATYGVGQRQLAFITHSLGGLLAKEVLRVANESSDPAWNAIGKSTRLVCFLSTPHTGASLAAVLKFLIPHIASAHIKTLSNDNGYLRSLNKAYRDIASRQGLSTVAYYEKHRTKSAVLVVSPESADPGVSDCRPMPVEADHIEICKFGTRDNLVYRSISRQVRRIVDATAPAADPVLSSSLASASDRGLIASSVSSEPVVAEPNQELISLNLPLSTVDRIAVIRLRIEAGSDAEVVRRALRLYERLVTGVMVISYPPGSHGADHDV